MARTTYMTAHDIRVGPDTDLQSIVYGALIKVANDVMNEPASTAGSPMRRKWGERVRRDPTFSIPAALTAMAFDTGIRTKYASNPATITDAEVEAVIVAKLWDLISESM